MARRFPTFVRPIPFKLPYGPADVALFFGVFVLIYGVARVGSGFFVEFQPPKVTPKISLDPSNLPYYAIRSTLRMFIALVVSIVFTLSYGYACAKNRFAEKILVPLLDILQSVPVLGFLSVTVTGFIALFPGRLIGLELASIFAIFTGQAWNMTFSFYHSLITLPRELEEASIVFRLSKWRKFKTVEVPAAMIGLVWNAMMSFGGGWFFVAATEAISVLDNRYTLPGIGSYVWTAGEHKDLRALGYAFLAMVVVIGIVDQLFWRPVVAWSDKFKMDRTPSQEPPTSWVYDLIKASRIPRQFSRFYRRTTRHWPKLSMPKPNLKWPERRRRTRLRFNEDVVFGVLMGALIVVGLVVGGRFVGTEVHGREVLNCVLLGTYTLLRVIVLLIFASIIWTPIGVMIGFNPRLARISQPVVLLLASFPSNFIFPAAMYLLVRANISLNIGSIALMALGAQWYILFNSIAGAMAVPNDLREMAADMGVKGWPLWKKLILPAIFPAWVTGAITASGGAWNASIVAEVVRWGDRTFTADGLGSYITNATTSTINAHNDWPRIVLGVTLMALFVVCANRLFWRRLYALAESRYRMA